MSCGWPEWAPFFLDFMKEELKQNIYNLALPLVEAQGLKIWGLELTGNPPQKLALYIDTPENIINPSANGPSASIEQCESISRQLGLALDVEDQIAGPWTLEVSSPGLERKFFNVEQMAPYLGDILEISLHQPQQCCDQPAKNIRGKLIEATADSFTIEPCQIGANGEVILSNCAPCLIMWENCRQVRRMYIFTPPKKPGKSGKKKSG